MLVKFQKEIQEIKMKEEYGSGFDGTPEQALKYAQDTPGQELEVKRLLKLIRKVVKDKYNGRTRK